MLDESWDENAKILSGRSSVVIDDPYVLTVYLPKGCRLKAADVTGEEAEFANQTEIATVRIVPSATETVQWSMSFVK